MSKLKLYGVKDMLSDEFQGRVLVLPADLVARRIFVEACSDSRSELAKYPADYELWRIGTLDTVSGSIEPDLERIMRGEVPVKDGL